MEGGWEGVGTRASARTLSCKEQQIPLIKKSIEKDVIQASREQTTSTTSPFSPLTYIQPSGPGERRKYACRETSSVQKVSAVSR